MTATELAVTNTRLKIIYLQVAHRHIPMHLCVTPELNLNISCFKIRTKTHIIITFCIVLVLNYNLLPLNTINDYI